MFKEEISGRLTGNTLTLRYEPIPYERSLMALEHSQSKLVCCIYELVYCGIEAREVHGDWEVHKHTIPTKRQSQ
jgi:hypothetical protein